MAEGMCVICGRALTSRQRVTCSKPCRTTRLMASDAYRRAQLKRHTVRPCIVCGEDFASKHGEARFCPPCNRCRRTRVAKPKPIRSARRRAAQRRLKRAARGSSGRHVWTAGTCPVCAVPFVTNQPATVVCSPRCAKARSRRAQRQRHGRIDIARKRARHFGVKYEPISRHRVFERDAYRCGLCGGQTDPTHRVPHSSAPTLDHVVPMSRGGSHTYDNVQCAHFECNWQKGADVVDEPFELTA